MVAPRRLELRILPWEGSVLTAWPWGLVVARPNCPRKSCRTSAWLCGRLLFFPKNLLLCKIFFTSFFFCSAILLATTHSVIASPFGGGKIFGKGYSTIRRTFLQVKSVCFKKTCVGRRKRNNNPIFNGRISCSLLLHLSLRSQINRPRAPCHNKTPTSYNLSVDFFDLSYRTAKAYVFIFADKSKK